MLLRLVLSAAIVAALAGLLVLSRLSAADCAENKCAPESIAPAWGQTPTPHPTHTATPRPSVTPTQGATPSPTVTPPTPIPSRTPTATPSPSPTPSATPSP